MQRSCRAAILSIGDELTSGATRDANAGWLAEQLAAIGITVSEIRIVPDDRPMIAGTIRELAQGNDVLVMTGGLGPTADDLTRLALGDVIDPGAALVVDPIGIAHVESWFATRGRPMPEINRVQALRPASARLLPNAHGTAPGLAANMGACELFVLPGVPREMRPMFEESVRPRLVEAADGHALIRRSVHVFGLGESSAAELLGELLARDREPKVGTTASEGIVSARIYARGERGEMIVAAEATLRAVEKRLHPFVFGRDGMTLAEAAGEALLARGERVVTAESCTGGLIGALLTERSGSSAYYAGGWITYSNAMKTARLGVPEALLAAHGAVSAPVAEAMARGALLRSEAHHALAVTGIAGPTGGDERKPVGTVFIARASRMTIGREEASNTFIGDVEVDVRHFIFGGDRDGVRLRAAGAALQMLRWHLLGVPREQRMPLEHEGEQTMVNHPDERREPA